MIKKQAVAACSWASDRLDVFGLGTDGGMFHKSWDGMGWLPAGWQPLGGRFISAPAVVSWGKDRLDVFCVGASGRMFHKSWDGKGWYPADWQPLGGRFISAPAVVSRGKDRLDVFGVGTDGRMLYKSWDGKGWHPSADWEPLGGTFISAPAVVSWGVDRLDVFGVGTSGGMFHKSLDGKGWHPSADWEPLGGQFISSPAVVSWGKDRLDVFGVGTDGRMFHKSWGDKGWYPSAGWQPLGGTFISSPAVVSRGKDRLDVFGVGTDGGMFHKSWAGKGWIPPAAWQPVGGDYTSALCVVSWDSDRLDVFGLGTDDGMFHKSWEGDVPWEPTTTDESLGGTFKALTDYRVFVIFWGDIFPPAALKNWLPLTPYTPHQYVAALHDILTSGYFSELDQYHVGQIAFTGPIVSNDPWPNGEATFVTKVSNDDVVALIKRNFNKLFPTPPHVGERKPIYLVVLPAGAVHAKDSEADTSEVGEHWTFQNDGDEVIVAYGLGDGTLDAAMTIATHELVEALGLDGGAPKELCDDCKTANPAGAPGPGGVIVETYFDAVNNRCVAPPSFPPA